MLYYRGETTVHNRPPWLADAPLRLARGLPWVLHDNDDDADVTPQGRPDFVALGLKSLEKRKCTGPRTCRLRWKLMRWIRRRTSSAAVSAPFRAQTPCESRQSSRTSTPAPTAAGTAATPVQQVRTDCDLYNQPNEEVNADSAYSPSHDRLMSRVRV